MRTPPGHPAAGPPPRRRHRWWAVLRRCAVQVLNDELPDRAATLTYYGVLAVFPALLLLVALLGVFGSGLTDSVLENLQLLAPGPAREVLRASVQQLRAGGGSGGWLAAAGLLGALWSASGYIGAFIRASNAVHGVREGRPVWKLTPLQLGLTLVMMAMLLASAVIVVFTGPVAERAGTLLGVGPTAVRAWAVAKWPVLLLLVSFMIALLYWAAPDVRRRGLRWVSPGSVLAVLLWLALSVGFAVVVTHVGSYNRVYGTLAGVIVFLVWLWLSNLAILLGLQVDAELARTRRPAADGPG
ncbi:YihY/virulence factor BrkB family protein [Kitasatospora sp. NPDC088391]|uniref:YihY/virulence factor BrkB family protein n=1 Tax=Kitasatospora sp. NPDC088391 TaxID=3364074 RepID=UPI0038048314